MDAMNRRYFLKLLSSAAAVAALPASALSPQQIPAWTKLRNGLLIHYCHVPADAVEIVFDVHADEHNGDIKGLVVHDLTTKRDWHSTQGMLLTKTDNFRLQIAAKADKTAHISITGE